MDFFVILTIRWIFNLFYPKKQINNTKERNNDFGYFIFSDEINYNQNESDSSMDYDNGPDW